MRPGARISAAIEILSDVLTRHRSIAEALNEWGKSHRFAGSGDRNAIGGLVYDALRQRGSIAWAMGSDEPRALALGAAAGALGMTPQIVIEACDGSTHAPAILSETECAGLTRDLAAAPPHVQANVPEWVFASFKQSFGARAVEEGRRMAERAPADLRVNTLKSTREKVLKALASFGAQETVLSPIGVRITPPIAAQRTPNLLAEAAFEAGWFEVQDEGSQIAALLAGAGPGQQVLDLCAGGGGKTLAMAAAMQNRGQIYAYDEDRLRLKPIFERVKRAGVRNLQVLRGGDHAALEALGPRFDLVLVDSPCTGTGTWRRRPDAKWRLKAHSIDNRQGEQRALLDLAGTLVKPGGRLVYITCSILPQENSEQIVAFLARHPIFQVVPYGDVWRDQIGTVPPASADRMTDTLLLTPFSHNTDGFFIAILESGK